MANTTDSISIFAEGTYAEQIQDLVLYVARNHPEEERATFVAPFQEALKTEEGKKPIDEDEVRRKTVFSMLVAEVKDLGDGTEKEIEGFFNLLYSHLFALYPPESPEAKQYLITFLKTISSSTYVSIKYRILSNLFNVLPRRSPLRLTVYNALLDVAITNDDIDALQLTRTDVEKWLSEWDIAAEEKSSFLKVIVDAYAQAGQLTICYEYSISYVRSLSPTSPEAKTAAVDLIATALRLPSIFDFDALFKLSAIMAVKDHELFSLLRIFLNDGLPEYENWEASHQGALQKYQLDSKQLERKIRLLTLATLGFQNVGQNLPYSKVAEALHVEPAEVESWIIDVIRAGLLWGKMSQTSQRLHITRSTARTFDKDQWQVLEKRLIAWKSGLGAVLEVVANARRMAGFSPAQGAV